MTPFSSKMYAMLPQNRTKFTGIAVLICVLFLLGYQGLNQRQYPMGVLDREKVWPVTAKKDISLAAHNRTLGFEKIYLINLPSRTDRLDWMTLLASLTNVELTLQDGVNGSLVAEKAKPAGSNNLKPEQLGCWRSHADVWQRMVTENVTSAIILEDDADWDVDVHNIFERLSRQMRQTKLRKLPPTAYEEEHAPYGLEWDMLYIGSCWDIPNKDNRPQHEVYDDPSAPNKNEMSGAYSSELSDWGVHLTDETRVRVLAPTWYSVCTVGYAVTLQGAKRLLYTVGNGKGLQGPVDLAIMSAIQNNLLSSLTLVPPPVVPWKTGTVSDSDIDDLTDTADKTPKGSESLRNSGKKALDPLLSGQASYNDLGKS
ncbi:hypothetical protein C2857_007617 [Epichloe festucae Fl1]|uniref:Glycosyl transferase family 25 domain-containing protein n=1 Tax=Epichloe festucae (strain Fl1) TaxID=877507 RepID=A0A7S9KQW8_EPIFF|nr:hypothetical protein C2857_007617 [Epichloe festucae Fl1]